jgi:hypothetical protein
MVFDLGGDICTNVNCSDLCIRSSNGPICMCEDGSKVLPGQKCPVSLTIYILPFFFFHLVCLKLSESWPAWSDSSLFNNTHTQKMYVVVYSEIV